MYKKEIFLVTCGTYSDYMVCAVFSERELAQKYVDSFAENEYDNLRIEVYVLDPFKQELIEGYNPYFLRMAKNGDCKEIRVKDSTYGLEDGELDKGFDVHGNMYMSVFARDEKHAIKIANEKRVQLIANNLWGI